MPPVGLSPDVAAPTFRHVLPSATALFLVLASSLRAEPLQPELLHSFAIGPRSPLGGLVQGADGYFYGATRDGGQYNYGTAFRAMSGGHITQFASFNSPVTGSGPLGNLVFGNDGHLYGVAEWGGSGANGTVFRLTTSGAITPLVAFAGPNGQSPDGGLAVGLDGAFYGVTRSGGARGEGTIFRVTADGTFTTLVSFEGTNGSSPRDRLVRATDGSFYGTTSLGGIGRNGTLFRVTPEGTLTTLHLFDGTNGAEPYAGLTWGNDGFLYGTTRAGGLDGYGTAFKVTTTGQLTTIASFSSYGMRNPWYHLNLGRDGNFYGVASSSTNAIIGTAFRLTHSGVLTRLVTFTGNNGMYPSGPIIAATDGQLYGLARAGGAAGSGTMFRLTPSGQFSLVASFVPSPMGNSPYDGLALANDGTLYGVARAGGINGSGAIFRVNTNGLIASVASFGPTTGSSPNEVLVGPDGRLYGTTFLGGVFNHGTVYRATTGGSIVTLNTFSSNPSSGSSSWGALVLGLDGNYYGTTASGGPERDGTVFRVTPGGAFTSLATFSPGQGEGPRGALVQHPDGYLYGTTTSGGVGGGMVFRVSTNGELVGVTSTELTPVPGLTLGANGELYGATLFGGASGRGSVYRVADNGVYYRVASLTPADGNIPRAPLVTGPDGNLYGTTDAGGTADRGTIFQVTPEGSLTTLASFQGTNGANPHSKVTWGLDGNLYGTTLKGGNEAGGTVYRVRLAPRTMAQPSDRTNTVGESTAFSIGVKGLPPLSFQWQKNGTNLVDEQHVSGATSATLTIDDLQVHHGGSYRVVVSNFSGLVTSSSAFLTVNSPPLASPVHFARLGRAALSIDVGALLDGATSDPDGDPRFLSDLGMPTHGQVVSKGMELYYEATEEADDSFTYTVIDGRGGVGTATIHVHLMDPDGPSANVVSMTVNVNGQPEITFAGIPEMPYAIQRSAPSLLGPWITLLTTNAPPNGLFTFTDLNPPAGDKFYRTVVQ